MPQLPVVYGGSGYRTVPTRGLKQVKHSTVRGRLRVVDSPTSKSVWLARAKVVVRIDPLHAGIW
jgi:hypothetical protein